MFKLTFIVADILVTEEYNSFGAAVQRAEELNKAEILFVTDEDGKILYE